MTYFSFLLRFVVLPLVAMLVLCRKHLQKVSVWLVFGGLLLIVYPLTSWWDNEAVARGFWSFDPQKISGIELIHLPIEEYLFFGLQTLLTGIWVWTRLHRKLVTSRE